MPLPPNYIEQELNRGSSQRAVAEAPDKKLAATLKRFSRGRLTPQQTRLFREIRREQAYRKSLPKFSMKDFDRAFHTPTVGETAFQLLSGPSETVQKIPGVKKGLKTLRRLPGPLGPIAGFAGEVVTDPLTYLTFGTAGLGRNIIRLTIGKRLASTAIRSAAKAGDKASKRIISQAVTRAGGRVGAREALERSELSLLAKSPVGKKALARAFGEGGFAASSKARTRPLVSQVLRELRKSGELADLGLPGFAKGGVGIAFPFVPKKRIALTPGLAGVSAPVAAALRKTAPGRVLETAVARITPGAAGARAGLGGALAVETRRKFQREAEREIGRTGNVLQNLRLQARKSKLSDDLIREALDDPEGVVVFAKKKGLGVEQRRVLGALRRETNNWFRLLEKEGVVTDKSFRKGFFPRVPKRGKDAEELVPGLVIRPAKKPGFAKQRTVEAFDPDKFISDPFHALARRGKEVKRVVSGTRTVRALQDLGVALTPDDVARIPGFEQVTRDLAKRLGIRGDRKGIKELLELAQADSPRLQALTDAQRGDLNRLLGAARLEQDTRLLRRRQAAEKLVERLARRGETKREKQAVLATAQAAEKASREGIREAKRTFGQAKERALSRLASDVRTVDQRVTDLKSARNTLREESKRLRSAQREAADTIARSETIPARMAEHLAEEERLLRELADEAENLERKLSPFRLTLKGAAKAAPEKAPFAPRELQVLVTEAKDFLKRKKSEVGRLNARYRRLSEELRTKPIPSTTARPEVREIVERLGVARPIRGVTFDVAREAERLASLEEEAARLGARQLEETEAAAVAERLVRRVATEPLEKLRANSARELAQIERQLSALPDPPKGNVREALTLSKQRKTLHDRATALKHIEKSIDRQIRRRSATGARFGVTSQDFLQTVEDYKVSARYFGEQARDLVPVINELREQLAARGIDVAKASTDDVRKVAAGIRRAARLAADLDGELSPADLDDIATHITRQVLPQTARAAETGVALRPLRAELQNIVNEAAKFANQAERRKFIIKHAARQVRKAEQRETKALRRALGREAELLAFEADPPLPGSVLSPGAQRRTPLDFIGHKFSDISPDAVRVEGTFIGAFEGIRVHPDIRRELLDQFSPQRIGRFLEGFDHLTATWKRNVTIWVPGFHLRNRYGGWINNFLGGTTHTDTALTHAVLGRASSQGRAVRGLHIALGSKGDLDKKISKLLGKYGYHTLDDLMAAVSEQNILSIHSVSMLRELTEGRVFRSPVAKFTVKWGGKGIQFVEDMNRLEGFISGLRLFDGDANRARLHVLRRQGDYNELTKTETHLRRLIPFYRWSRTNTPLQIQTMMERPGRTLQVERFVQTVIGDPEATEEARESGLLPEFIRRGGGVILRPGLSRLLGPLGGGGAPTAISLDLPTRDLQLFPTTTNPLAAAVQTVNNLTQMLHPAVKLFIEWAGQAQESRGQVQDFEPVPVRGGFFYKFAQGLEKSRLFGPDSDLPLVGRDPKTGTLYLDKKLMPFLRMFPTNRFTNFLSDITDFERRIQSATSFLTGVGVRPLDAKTLERQLIIMLARLKRAEREGSARVSSGF